MSHDRAPCRPCPSYTNAMRALSLTLLLSVVAGAQSVCPPTPIYSVCEISFDLTDAEKKEHPNPYLSLQMHAEIRSPRHRTVALPAFWNGEKMIIRFAANDPGDWEFRISSSLKRYEGKSGKISATAAAVPGFVIPANGHHWMTSENRLAHLWMGDVAYELPWMERTAARALIEARAGARFTHLRFYAMSGPQLGAGAFTNPDQPNVEFYRKLDEFVSFTNDKGMVADLILGRANNQVSDLFRTPAQRERYLRYMVARYAAFNVTWQLVQSWETYSAGRDLLREMGTVLKRLDPYGHPRSAHADETSAPLLSDGWMDHVLYGSSDDQLGAIEHQMVAAPRVSIDFATSPPEQQGTRREAAHVSFRKQLWNATMNGQYPVARIASGLGGPAAEAPNAKAMNTWFDFMSKTRYWELEPYFDVDGARGVALPGTEYIVYIEEPTGPIEVRLEKHGYDVKWLNPGTGEVTLAEGFKSEKFVIEPPSREHDWILHISREGRKEGMLRSYKFESRPFLMQEIEGNAAKAPFEIAQPSEGHISASKPGEHAVKLRRDTRATRAMVYLWTGEVATGGAGYRVLGTGPAGKLRIPGVFVNATGVMNMRVFGMNSNGKLYAVDRIYRIVP